MNVLNLLTSAIKFLVSRLEAYVASLEAKAQAHTAAINQLIAARMVHMEEAGKASALANNIRKLL